MALLATAGAVVGIIGGSAGVVALCLGELRARRSAGARIVLEGTGLVRSAGPTLQFTLRNDGPGTAREVVAEVTIGGTTLRASGADYIRGKEETDNRGARQALYECRVAIEALSPGPAMPPGVRAAWRYRSDSGPLRVLSWRRGSEMLGGQDVGGRPFVL